MEGCTFLFKLQVGYDCVVPTASTELFNEMFLYFSCLNASSFDDRIQAELQPLEVGRGSFTRVLECIQELGKELLPILDCGKG